MELPDKASIGGVTLKKVSAGKAPEHYQWKRILEKSWAGAWTLAGLTGYRYKMGLDPAFVCEQPKYRAGQLHWYEWILCENGGIIHLYGEREKTLTLLTTTQTAAKVLVEVKESRLALDAGECLGKEVRFPAAVFGQVCELAGARMARKGRPLASEQLAVFAAARKRGMEKIQAARRSCPQAPQKVQFQEIMPDPCPLP